MSRACVIGCGVNGLTAAFLLSKGGWDVEVFFEKYFPKTTSYVATALWHPFLVENSPRILKWSEISYKWFDQLSTDPNTGVFMANGFESFDINMNIPSWASIPKNFVADTNSCLKTRWFYSAPVIEMPRYLSWLQSKCVNNKVKFTQKKIKKISAQKHDCDLIINTAGVGARSLNSDLKVMPIRGQVTWVEKILEIDHFHVFHLQSGIDGYIVPRSRDIVIGTTIQENDLEKNPRKKDATFIKKICEEVEPRIASARVLAHRVGHRPYRHEVCHEAERKEGFVLASNYGHGGSGVTMSWGSNLDLLEKIKKF